MIARVCASTCILIISCKNYNCPLALARVFSTSESQLYLYDTGYQHPTHGGDLFTKVYAGNLKRTLENFCYSSSNNDKHLVKKVDGVVISHPHFDHYAGLNFLAKHLPECLKHTKLVVTANFDPVKLLRNASCELGDITLPESHLQFNTEVSDLFFGSEDLFHFYFHKKLPPQLYHITLAGPKEAKDEKNEHDTNVSTPLCPTGSSGINPKKKSEKYTASDWSCEKLNPNESSIILKLRPLCTPDYPSVLLTGDAPAHRVLEAAGERLSVFQVPHHGSRFHLPRTIVDKLQWVDHLALLLALSHRHQSLVPHIEALHKNHALKKPAEAFKTYVSQIGKTLSQHLMETLINPLFTLDNCFPKGSIQVEWYNQHHGIFPRSVIEEVEEEKKKQKRNLTFFKDSLGWAHFYLKVRADLYVVSAGKPFHHPHPEVVTGIIIACKWRKDKCNLAFTNDANLKDFVLSFPSEVRKVASESTQIWYLSTFNSSSPQ